MVSTSISLPPLPSFMIEPLPKFRSIWDSAASSALVLSMEAPSITRNAAGAIVVAPYDRDSEGSQTDAPPGAAPVLDEDRVYTVCSLFAICSFWKVGTGLFRPPVAGFENSSGLLWPIVFFKCG